MGAVIVALCSLSGLLPAAAPGIEALVQEARVVAAVEILSVDDALTPADGPMYVEARVLKVIKGSVRVRQQIRFGATSWVGPTYRAGEERIVFLAPVPAGPSYYSKAGWSSIEAGKIDLFFDPDELKNCSETLLREFLRKIESAGNLSPGLEGKLVRSGASAGALTIELVNESDEAIWLNPSKLVVSVELGQVRHALAIDWGGVGNGEWVPLQAAAVLSGEAAVGAFRVEAVTEPAMTFGHLAARFPHAAWVGYRRGKVEIRQ